MFKGFKGCIFRVNIYIFFGYDVFMRIDIECLFWGLLEFIDIEIDEEGKFMYWIDRGEFFCGNSLNRVERGFDG